METKSPLLFPVGHAMAVGVTFRGKWRGSDGAMWHYDVPVDDRHLATAPGSGGTLIIGPGRCR